VVNSDFCVASWDKFVNRILVVDFRFFDNLFRVFGKTKGLLVVLFCVELDCSKRHINSIWLDLLSSGVYDFLKGMDVFSAINIQQIIDWLNHFRHFKLYFGFWSGGRDITPLLYVLDFYFFKLLSLSLAVELRT